MGSECRLPALLLQAEKEARGSIHVIDVLIPELDKSTFVSSGLASTFLLVLRDSIDPRFHVDSLKSLNVHNEILQILDGYGVVASDIEDVQLT